MRGKRKNIHPIRIEKVIKLYKQNAVCYGYSRKITWQKPDIPIGGGQLKLVKQDYENSNENLIWKRVFN